MVNLLLASFQKRIGGKLGVAPGTELLAAIDAAKDAGIPYSLDDRDIRTTMLRAWRSMSLWQKSKLLSAVAASAFGEVELTEDDLRELREQDVLSGLMDELAGHMPTLKRVLIDERDRYLAEKIRNAPGARVVAVVGAGHVRGIRTVLEGPAPREPLDVERVPPASPVWKWVGWSIPALIVGSLVLLAWTKGGAVAGHNLGIWILANGIPAAIGAVAGLAHPGTILAAFVAAPITSLSPLIGAGYVTAFVQAYLRPPRVRDFHDVAEDAAHPSAWWRNRLLKVFLAFLLPSLGSVLGTFVGGYKILSNLF